MVFLMFQVAHGESSFSAYRFPYYTTGTLASFLSSSYSLRPKEFSVTDFFYLLFSKSSTFTSLTPLRIRLRLGCSLPRIYSFSERSALHMICARLYALACIFFGACGAVACSLPAYFRSQPPRAISVFLTHEPLTLGDNDPCVTLV